MRAGVRPPLLPYVPLGHGLELKRMLEEGSKYSEEGEE